MTDTAGRIPTSDVFSGMTRQAVERSGLMDEHPGPDKTNEDDEQAEQVKPAACKNTILIGPARRLGVLFPSDLIGMYYLG